MRQKLIKWLIEDIIPDAQETKNPEQSILKFSSANNLAPAQVEMLGQLFNTAKTLSHLEKSANRGASFPILDVPKMVSSYLEMPTNPADITHQKQERIGKSADVSLPECMRGWESVELGEEQEVKLAAVNAAPEDNSIFAKEKKYRSNRRDENVSYADLEMMKQAKSDFIYEGQKCMAEIHQGLRENSDISFPDLETDALSLYGESIIPVMEKLAKYLGASKWPIKRGSKDDTKRLIPEYAGLMDKLGKLEDTYYMGEAATDCIKKATAAAVADPIVETAQDAGAQDAGIAGAQSAGNQSESKKKDNVEDKDKGSKSPSDGQGKGKGQSGQGKGRGSSGKPSESFFGGINKTLDTAAGKGYGLMEPVLQKALGGGYNDNQQRVDQDYMDARHMATLQKLMTTDEVLSEADPEHVVSVYNTLREMAPSLAGDANVMRVALRSAIQHEGISPFDIKSFLDTEAARQKTDYNRKLKGHLDYGGGEMGNRPA